MKNVETLKWIEDRQNAYLSLLVFKRKFWHPEKNF